MEKLSIQFSFSKEAGEIDWAALKKPGSSRYIKSYNKADFVGSAINLEPILGSVKSK
jgi:hypothetical protein